VLADAKFELDCPKCGKKRTYKTKIFLERAKEKKSVCSSCRTAANNKKRIGTKQKENNPAWKGYKHIPGKVFSKLKRDAATREISFDITIEDINDKYEQQDMRCALSGIPVLFGINASVDRIDSDKGYTKDNIQIVLSVVNIMKRDIPEDLFIMLCKNIAERHK
jgi:hypothetical protein